MASENETHHPTNIIKTDEEMFEEFSEDCENSENQSPKDYKDIIKISRVCRLCARLTNEEYAKNIFKDKDTVGKINFALPINVTSDDGLPNYICNQCEEMLNKFHDFVCEVVKADTQLRTPETNPSDHVTRAIEEIFGVDSDDDFGGLQSSVKPTSLESKRLKTDTTLTGSMTHKYICQKCSKSFQEFSVLLDHYRAKHSTKSLQTPETNSHAKTENESVLEDEEDTLDSTDDPVVCNKCSKIFLNRETLHKHQRNKHSVNVCSICWMNFDTGPSYEQHMAQHRNSIKQQCIFCYKVYQTQQGLRKHTLHYHTGKVMLRPNVPTDDG